MDPDPGDPKTCGSGFGSGTLISRILRQALNWPKVADGTGEGFLARVDPHVLLKASLIVEFLIAHGAGMDELALVLVLAHAPLVPIPVHR